MTANSMTEVKIKKFHQLVRVEHGPVNSAIIDLLKGNVYQVENSVVDRFNRQDYESITDFMESLENEELVIEIDEARWVPRISYQPDPVEEISFGLEVEAGVDWRLVEEKFNGENIDRIVYFGDNHVVPSNPSWAKMILTKQLNFADCAEASTVDGDFPKIDEAQYHFNTKYNSCWGRKIAITKDGKVRPCIYSEIEIGDLAKDTAYRIMKQARQYWTLTKAKVKRCQDCELKSVCFDCREIARRATGDLYAPNPHCRYDPYTGQWMS